MALVFPVLSRMHEKEIQNNKVGGHRENTTENAENLLLFSCRIKSADTPLK